ncbi:MAG: DUF3786 domain-containing protein [Methanomassiliicoccus sp.]|nr:DUF3786 domain-containing protein [Methanomassiliicoccus sp.]
MSEAWCPGSDSSAYAATLNDAWDALEAMDVVVQARKAGAVIEDGRIVLDTLGRRCAIDPWTRSVTVDDREIEVLEAVVVLHYLARAGDVRPRGHLISYRQLPGGGLYYPTFRSRVISVIEEMDRNDPGMLLRAGQCLGGENREFGSASITIPIFPLLPVTIILWRGDDEIPGSANVLFDESASCFLPTEDLAAVGTMLVTRLMEAGRTSMEMRMNAL